MFNSPKAQVFSVILAVAAFHLAFPCFYALTGINPHCHGLAGALTLNGAVINYISYICAFPAATVHIVCCDIMKCPVLNQYCNMDRHFCSVLDKSSSSTVSLHRTIKEPLR